jgi:transposase
MDINTEDIKLQLEDEEILDLSEIAKQFNIKERYVVYAYAISNGMSHAQATKHIGIKSQQYTWEYRVKHPEVDQLIGIFSKGVMQTLNGKAIQTIEKLLGDRSSNVRLNAAKYIIDRNLGENAKNININQEKDPIDLLLQEMAKNKKEADIDGDE